MYVCVCVCVCVVVCGGGGGGGGVGVVGGGGGGGGGPPACRRRTCVWNRYSDVSFMHVCKHVFMCSYALRVAK
jgi:hypothetical protein